MDNPNNSGRLRRHNSLPSKFQIRSSLIPSQLRMKSNPYIGSFRHSPPTSLHSMKACAEPRHHGCPNAILLKTSPYVGWFRHAPPTGLRTHQVDPKKNLSSLDRFQHQILFERARDQMPYDLAMFINGKLLGGCNDENSFPKSMLSSTTFSSTLNNPSMGRVSSTAKLLDHIISWFLFPIAYDSESGGYTDFPCDDFHSKQQYCMSSTSSSDDSETSLPADSSNMAPLEEESIGEAAHGEETMSKSSVPLGTSVSNVAGAYYAHQAIEQVDDLSPDGHCLDYVITQMDIARMARNASRHLDVESILTLPTMTYHCPPTSKSKSGMQTKESWSFVVVPEERNGGSSGSEDNFCVICMEPFVEGDRLRVLPCNHSFHVGCIDRWLSGSHSHFECHTSGCPTCKKKPLDAERHVSSSNDGSVPSWAFVQLGDAMARSLSTP